VSTHSIHQFAEKVALITDGTSPAGRAIALQLALNGAYVIVGEPGGGEPDSSIEELKSLGTLASSIAWNADSSDGPKELVDGAAGRFERIDFLVNCLKYGGQSAFIETTGKELRELMAREIVVAYSAVQAAYAWMKDRPRARVVNVLAGAPPAADDAANAIIDAAVRAMTSSMAAALPGNFRVNAVATKAPAEAAPDDIARAVLYLLSSEAKAVQGETISLTG
jgi:NAD(P)-dependent dehydrogenase (short-subunit alcohol dehydrogenase family)